MWKLIERFFVLLLLTAAAAGLYLIGTVVWSWWQGTDPSGTPAVVDPTGENLSPLSAEVEIRVASRGGASRLFAGQPFVFDVIVMNLGARRAQNRVQTDPDATATATEIPLDALDTPWERRLRLEMIGTDGTRVLDGFNWSGRLLDGETAPAGRRLAMTPVRATFVIEREDFAALAPGSYVIRASLPPEIRSPDTVRVVPLELSMRPAPGEDAERAVVELAVADVAALRGDMTATIEAGRRALDLDPLQDRALTVIAEAYETAGDLENAVAWYERYLATLPDTQTEYRDKLAAYVDALRPKL
jgi:hypothetical protein